MQARRARKMADGCGACSAVARAGLPVPAKSAKRNDQVGAGLGRQSDSVTACKNVGRGWTRSWPLCSRFPTSRAPAASSTGDDPLDLMRRVPNLLACSTSSRGSVAAARRTWTLIPAICDCRAFLRRPQAELCNGFPPGAGSGAHRRRFRRMLLRPTDHADDDATAALVRAVIEEQTTDSARFGGPCEDLMGRVGSAVRAACQRAALRPRGDLGAARSKQRATAAFAQRDPDSASRGAR